MKVDFDPNRRFKIKIRAKVKKIFFDFIGFIQVIIFILLVFYAIIILFFYIFYKAIYFIYINDKKQFFFMCYDFLKTI